VAADSAGNAYITGGTQSSDFPTTSPLQSSLNGSASAFVTVLNQNGSAMLFSSYLGADGVSSANGIALDNAGNVYVTGLTTSTNFPNTGRRTGDVRTTFVTKLSLGTAPPPVTAKLFQSFGFDAQRNFALGIQGEKNRSYVLEFSTDLKQWLTLTQATTSGDGTLRYVDTSAALFPAGFYRIR
jgi:hypothetical protein